MTHQIPDNNVTIRDKDGGGIEMLLDGYDLAPHADHWQVEFVAGDPFLTVRIPCSSLSVEMTQHQVPGVSINVTAPSARDVGDELRRALRPLGGDFR